MHRRAVICDMCGKAFFPASLKIHKPQCLKKQQMMHIPCSYCNCEFRRIEMPEHLKKCAAARRHKKKAAARAQKQAQQHQRSASAGYAGTTSNTSFRSPNHGFGGKGGLDTSDGFGSSAPHSSFGDEFAHSPEAQFGGEGSGGNDTFGRIPCRFCGRKFDGARIGKHQNVCSKLKHGPPKRLKAHSGVGLGAAAREHKTQGHAGRRAATSTGGRRSTGYPAASSSSSRSTVTQRRGGGRSGPKHGARQGSKSAPRGNGGAPKNKTGWREQRAQLREAIKAGRQMTRFEKGLTDVMPDVKPSAPDPSFVQCPHCSASQFAPCCPVAVFAISLP